MLILRQLITVAVLAGPSQAFFPWFPQYRCHNDNTCETSKRALDADEARGRDIRGESVERSAKIVQRLPENDLPRKVQIEQLANRLRQKYQPGSQVRSETVEVPATVTKRQNKYKVITAAIPTTTNSEGILQDGTDFSYFAEVDLGSTNKPLYMLLDTGAGTSWVMGPSCTSEPCLKHKSFGAPDSTTFKTLSQPFSILYGSGAVKGVLATDSLSIAGMKFTHTFGIANETSNDFNSFPMDGILGLSLSKGIEPNFVETMRRSKLLAANIFGISLSRASDGPNTGVVNFGAPDTSQFQGTLAYTAVDTKASGDWAIPLADISFGDKAAGMTDKLAYIDTGTSFIFGPPDLARQLYALIPGAKTDDNSTYTVPCTTTTSLIFTFGTNSYAVSSRDWVGPETNGECTSNVFGYTVVDDAWLLGDTFLKNVYTVFNADEKRIGFAAKPAPQAPTTSRSTSPAATTGSATTSSSPTGGPNSLSSEASAVTLTSTSSAASGPSTSTVSNGNPAGSTDLADTPSPIVGGATETSSTSGLNGHETPDSPSTSVPDTSASPSQTSTNSGAAQINIKFVVVALAALIALIT